VTPEVLWNLIPWSWAIDWFANVGDVMSNMSSNAVNNLVADYAFVMESSQTVRTETVTTSWTGVGSPGGFYYFPAGSASASVSYETVQTKNRVAASPYGFGVEFGSLSNYQLGVVAALGISRWG